MTSFASFFANTIRKRPMLFNGLTGGFLCASSDAVAQQLEQTDRTDLSNSTSTSATNLHHSTTTFDVRRFASAGLIGVFFGAGVYPAAYAKLDAVWCSSKGFRTILKKSIVEIATVGIFVNSVSLTSRGLCKGDKSLNQVLDHVVEELPTVTRNDFFVWLPYNLMAFSVIPAVIRPTTTLMMEASWQTYISLRAHDFGQAEKANETIQQEVVVPPAATILSTTTTNSRAK